MISGDDSTNFIRLCIVLNASREISVELFFVGCLLYVTHTICVFCTLFFSLVCCKLARCFMCSMHRQKLVQVLLSTFHALFLAAVFIMTMNNMLSGS